MNDFLPLFPLKLVVYPGERLNLHIFEAKYKQLIRECSENKVTFGIPAFIDDQIMNIGTELKLEKIEKSYDNGELDIRTIGVGIFRIEEYYTQVPNKLYSGADIVRLNNNTIQSDPDINQKIYIYLLELFNTLSINQNKVPENSTSFNSYDIAHQLGLSLDQEYELLRIPSELERQVYIHEHLKRILPVAKEMEKLKAKALMNGHFKKIIPPI